MSPEQRTAGVPRSSGRAPPDASRAHGAAGGHHGPSAPLAIGEISLPAVLHILILVLAVALVWLGLSGQVGAALLLAAVGILGPLAIVLGFLYARRLGEGRTPTNDLLRWRAGLARRGGRLSSAAATYADARDADGIRRVALDAAHDVEAAEALCEAAEAYFALRGTITTARRHGVVPSLLLDRADESADAAAAQLWRSCDRLAVVGSSQSARIDAVLRSYDRAVRAVRAELESARDGIVQVAIGRVLETQLADVTGRLARLDRAARSIDQAMADALT